MKPFRPALVAPILLALLLACLSAAALTADVEYTPENFPRTLWGVKRAINAQPLPASARRFALNASEHLFDEAHPYIQLIRRARRVDPVRRLRVLRRRAARLTPYRFHASMRWLFQSVNDRHAQYLPPNPLRSALATLPVRTALYYDDGRQPRIAVPSLGARVTHVDGVDAVKLAKQLGLQSYANPGSQLRTGAQSLSVRFLALQPFPRRPATTFRLSFANGTTTTTTFKWSVSPLVDPGYSFLSLPLPSGTSTATTITAPVSGAALAPGAPVPVSPSHSTSAIAIAAPLDQYLTAYVVTLVGSDFQFGVLRIRTFDFLGVPQIVAELTRVLRLMPSTGLVLDIRDDLGGQADAAALIAELVSDAVIPAVPGQLRVSRTIRNLLNSRLGIPQAAALTSPFLRPFAQAEQAGEFVTPASGDVFSLLTGQRRPRVPRAYNGPVVALTNSGTYSAGELLVSLLKDLGIAYVVGMDDTTGGGACGPSRQSDLALLFPDAFRQPPQDMNLVYCIVRYFRTGAASGQYIEMFGIEPNEVYRQTLADVTTPDSDLFVHLEAKLRELA